MKNAIKPDKKYYIAQLLVLSVLSSFIIIGAVILNVIIYLEGRFRFGWYNGHLTTFLGFNIDYVDSFFPSNLPLDEKPLLFHP